MKARIFLLAVLALLLAAPPAAAQSTLNAEVSGALTIFLRQGTADVTHLDPGSYTINVNDASNQHNFRLTGPGGLEMRTDIWTVDPQVWTGLSFVDGLYHYNCEHHAQMFGAFTVGSVIWLEATGLGTGKVASAPGGVNWPHNRGAAFSCGSQVTLTAQPDSGSRFLGWSGGGCSGTGDCRHGERPCERPGAVLPGARRRGRGRWDDCVRVGHARPGHEDARRPAGCAPR